MDYDNSKRETDVLSQRDKKKIGHYGGVLQTRLISLSALQKDWFSNVFMGFLIDSICFILEKITYQMLLNVIKNVKYSVYIFTQDNKKQM